MSKIYIYIYIYMYIYVYCLSPSMGWSNNHFNSLHSKM